MDKVLNFFKEKKPWSEYKDLILDYYLKPYLDKVAHIGKPIIVVDCFAGPGKFGDGKSGSPLIISENLSRLYQRGVNVLGFYVEKNPILYRDLVSNTKNESIPIIVRKGRFKEHINEIIDFAKTHTTFVYLDPIRPTHLHFNDLKSVYNQLMSGQSIETLINFMSTGFLRAVWGQKTIQDNDGIFNKNHPRVLYWNQIAGGDYWQNIAFDNSKSQKERTDKLAKGYGDQLKRWFKYVLPYPIREKYEHEFPKYHLVFGTRWHEAVDLMNRAMLKARIQFLGKRFMKDYLFNLQPIEEDLDPITIRKTIINTSKKLGKVSWAVLRAYSTIEYPNMCTDSDFNKAIKELIKKGSLLSSCSGAKIENDALVWTQSKDS